MADNYLEKKFEQFRSGKPVYRKVNPSLDTLLSLASSQECRGDTSGVKTAQLEAMARSACKSCPGKVVSRIVREGSGLELLCPDMFTLGGAVLAARLKAYELHLKAVCTEAGAEDSDRQARAVIEVSR